MNLNKTKNIQKFNTEQRSQEKISHLVALKFIYLIFVFFWVTDNPSLSNILDPRLDIHSAELFLFYKSSHFTDFVL